MMEEPQNQGTGSIKGEIPQALHDAVALAGRVLDFCRQHVLDLPAPPKGYCWHAGQALLRVMHDQLEAARLYAEKQPHRPSPIMVSVRPIYEAMLYLRYLLRPDSAEERQALGWMFWAFHEWETIEAISRGSGGREAYEKQLPQADRHSYERRLEIAKKAETQFTRDQMRQLKRGRWNVTWTGRRIAELARELEEEEDHTFHKPWYGVMSMATHVSPGMIQWAYKLLESKEEFDPHALRCMKCSAGWLDRGSVTLFRCSQRFLERYGRVLPDEGRALLRDLKELKTLRGSSEDRRQDEGLRDDPVVRDLVDRMVQAVHPLRIILFGSAGLGDQGASDFDVLVIVRDGTNVGRAEDDMYRSMWDFPLPADLIAVTEEDAREHAANRNLIVHTALTEGEEIYLAAG